MGKRTNESNLASAAWKESLSTLPRLWPFYFGFFVMLLAASALCLLSYLVGILFFFLVALPFFFALMMSVILMKAPEFQLDNKTIFALYRSYFSFRFRSVFRALVQFFKAFAVFCGGFALFTLIYVPLRSTLDATFASTVQTAYQLYESGSSEAFLEYVYGSTELLKTIAMATVIPMGIAATALLLFLSGYSLNVYYRNAFPMVNPGAANWCYGRYYERVRPLWRPLLWKKGFFVPLAFALGYVLGATIGLLFSTNMSIVLALSFGMASVFVLPFVPYYLYLTLRFSLAHKREILQTQIDIFEEFDREARGRSDVPQEDRDQISRNLELARKALEEFDEKEEKKEE